MTGAILMLPFPPTANNLWLNVGKRRVRTPTYDAWIAESKLCCIGAKKVRGPYILTILATRPDRRRRDLSNLIKALEDLLVKAGIVEDDSLCESLRISWSGSEPVKGGAVMVTVEPWPLAVAEAA